MKKLHPVQQKLIDLLKENIDDPLTIRELQDELDLSSPSLVHHHIQQLEKKGYLRRNPLNPKDYQILADSPEKRVTYLNLYGLAQCGPNGSIFDGDVIERVPISSKILGFPSSEAFMVKAKGDSMIPKINEKDLVIARKLNDADNGSVVVCVNNGETLIKKIQKGNSTILISLNSKYEPFVASEDFRIEGVVKGVYSYDFNHA
jgi:repressor LexA